MGDKSLSPSVELVPRTGYCIESLFAKVGKAEVNMLRPARPADREDFEMGDSGLGGGPANHRETEGDD